MTPQQSIAIAAADARVAQRSALAAQASTMRRSGASSPLPKARHCRRRIAQMRD